MEVFVYTSREFFNASLKLKKNIVYKVQFRVFDLQTVARIVRAGEASSEAERRNEVIA